MNPKRDILQLAIEKIKAPPKKIIVENYQPKEFLMTFPERSFLKAVLFLAIAFLLLAIQVILSYFLKYKNLSLLVNTFLITSSTTFGIMGVFFLAGKNKIFVSPRIIKVYKNIFSFGYARQIPTSDAIACELIIEEKKSTIGIYTEENQIIKFGDCLEEKEKQWLANFIAHCLKYLR